jgi:hypothetical protein
MNYHYFPAIFAYFRREKPLKTYLMIHFLQKKQQYFEQKNATFIWRKYFKKIITSAPLNLSVVAANVGNLASGTHPRKIGTKGVDPTSRPDVSTNRMHSHTCLKKNWYGKKNKLGGAAEAKKIPYCGCLSLPRIAFVGRLANLLPVRHDNYDMHFFG